MNEKKLVNEIFENHIINKDKIFLNTINSKNDKYDKKYFRIVASFLLILLLPISVYAVSIFLSPAKASEFLNNEMLKAAFESDSSTLINETKTDNGYIVSFLGMTDSENLTSFEDIKKDTSYFVLGIKREDNSPISAQENFFISPIINGLSPLEYSIMTMNGSFSKNVLDGVLYVIIDIDSVKIFAHRGLQLAVIDDSFYDSDAFIMDNSTGVFSENQDYDGLNVLFDIPLDKSLGDEDAVLDYMADLKEAQSPPSAESSEITVEYFGDVTIDWFMHLTLTNFEYKEQFDEYSTTVSKIAVDFSDNSPQIVSVEFSYKFENDEDYKTQQLIDYTLDKEHALNILNNVYIGGGGMTFFDDDKEGRYVLEKREYILENDKIYFKTSVVGVIVYDYETYEFQKLIIE